MELVIYFVGLELGISVGLFYQMLGLALRLCLGQFLSCLVTGTGVFTQLLVARGVNTPALQTFVNYALLTFVYNITVLVRRQRMKGTPFWACALVAIADVEANFLAITAYQYTTITSVMLLDCFTIPCVMILTRLLTGARYKWMHLVGAAICLVGIVVLVLGDYERLNKGGDEGGTRELLGDALVLCAALLYAISNVAQEYLVKKYDRAEFLAMLGVCGLLISSIHLGVDYKNTISADYNWVTVSYLVGFSACLFSMYSAVPFMLMTGGAALMNLSLLTSDVMAVVSDILLFHVFPSVFCYVAVGLILIGLVLYNITSPYEESEALQKDVVFDPVASDQGSVYRSEFEDPDQ